MGSARATIGGKVLWKAGTEGGKLGAGHSVGSGEMGENQKEAMRLVLTIPSLNFPEGCFRA